MQVALRTRIRAMAPADIADIADIERESFTTLWPAAAYRRELQNNIARYLVLTEVLPDCASPGHPGVFGALRRIVSSDHGGAGHELVLGFIGIWLMVGEAHIVTFAVRERYRRKGIGERLLIAGMELARAEQQDVVTLEVRRSNVTAQQLYAKYGFSRLGLRTRYYTDNHEDAVIMTTADLGSDSMRERFEELRGEHQRRRPDLWP